MGYHIHCKMFLFRILFIGQLLNFSTSSSLDSDINPDLYSLTEECSDGQGPEHACFCYDEPKNDFEYKICPETPLTVTTTLKPTTRMTTTTTKPITWNWCPYRWYFCAEGIVNRLLYNKLIVQ